LKIRFQEEDILDKLKQLESQPDYINLGTHNFEEKGLELLMEEF